MANKMANLPQLSSTPQQQQQQQPQSPIEAQQVNQPMVFVAQNIDKSFDEMFKVIRNENLNKNITNGCSIPWRNKKMPKSFFEPPTSGSSSQSHSRDSSLDANSSPLQQSSASSSIQKLNSKPPTPITAIPMNVQTSPVPSSSLPSPMSSMIINKIGHLNNCTPPPLPPQLPPGLPTISNHKKAISLPASLPQYSKSSPSSNPVSNNNDQLINQNLMEHPHQQQQSDLNLQNFQLHNRQQSYDINRISLPDDWEMDYDLQTGERYFLNHKTKTTTWDDPRFLPINNNNIDNKLNHLQSTTLSHSNPMMNLQLQQQQQQSIHQNQQPSSAPLPSTILHHQFSSQPEIHTNNSQQQQQVVIQNHNSLPQPINQLQRRQINNFLKQQSTPTPKTTTTSNNEFDIYKILQENPNLTASTTTVGNNGNLIPVELVAAMENMYPTNPITNTNNLHQSLTNNNDNIQQQQQQPQSSSLMFASKIEGYEMEIRKMHEKQELLARMPAMQSDYKPLQQTSMDPFLSNSRDNLFNNQINNNNDNANCNNNNNTNQNHARQISQDSGLGSGGYPTLESPFIINSTSGADFINDISSSRLNNLLPQNSLGIIGDLSHYTNISTELDPELNPIELEELEQFINANSNVNMNNNNDVLIQLINNHDDNTMTWQV